MGRRGWVDVKNLEVASLADRQFCWPKVLTPPSPAGPPHPCPAFDPARWHQPEHALDTPAPPPEPPQATRHTAPQVTGTPRAQGVLSIFCIIEVEIASMHCKGEVMSDLFL